jgi:MinD-like ATPase involved in chromosome partitioning or flagellar assembly
MSPNLRAFCGALGQPESGDAGAGRSREDLKQLSHMSDYVLVDLPSQPSHAVRDLLSACDCAIVVVDREQTALEAGSWMVSWLLSEVSAIRFLGVVVVSRTPLDVPESFDLIRRRFGGAVLGVVPPAAGACALALQNRTTPNVLRPESAYASAVAEIAGGIAEASAAEV